MSHNIVVDTRTAESYSEYLGEQTYGPFQNNC